jgi:hypothetical protein
MTKSQRRKYDFWKEYIKHMNSKYARECREAYYKALTKRKYDFWKEYINHVDSKYTRECREAYYRALTNRGVRI